MKLESIFKNKTVLITGHTGFKGSWLTAWLKRLDCRVVGVSLDPVTEPSLFSVAGISIGIDDLRCDIRHSQEFEKIITQTQPDFVFHLAAQALVRNSYKDPIGTWSTNVMGTLNVLESLRKLKKECYAVIITSDKCYRNNEWVWGYREDDRLGGEDPYSASKGAAELAIHSYIHSFFDGESTTVRVASARAGNVIGGGDWSEDRIVPDCIRAWSSGRIVDLRNPHATRPWQHVLEPLSGYLSLAASLSESKKHHGGSFNFGPQAHQDKSVMELVDEMGKYWSNVQWVDRSCEDSRAHEAGLLRLSCEKAMSELQWYAAMGFSDTVKMTAEWYKNFYHNPYEIEKLTNAQIDEYYELAKHRGLDWAQ